VTGHEVTGSAPHLDLYYVTQDNYVRASRDGGQTWNFKICGEGKYFRTTPTSVDHQDAIVTGIGLGCKSSQVLPVNFRTEPHLVDRSFWKDAPNSTLNVGAQAPFPILPEVYLQGVTDVFMTSLTYDYFLSLSAGSAWAKSFTLNLKPIGIPAFAGFLANPTAYQGVERQGNLPNGGQRFGLMRAGNLAGQGVVTPADNGIFGLGSLRTPVARYVVFAADPKNANHLIAPDVSTNEMKFSVDGGLNWFPYGPLTKAVTDNGTYLFTIGEHSLASVIAWDPYDSCHILVGTHQNGIIRSTDGGSSWSQVKKSKVITRISSFYFPSQGSIWVSSDGRGLWNLNINRKNVSSKCRFPNPPNSGGGGGSNEGVILSTVNGSQQPFSGLNDSAVCPQCSLVVVQNGWIVDLERADDSIRKIAISGGTISQIDSTGREIPLAIPNAYQTDRNQIQGRLKLKRSLGNLRVRGLIFEGSQLRYLLLATGDLPFAPKRTPTVLALSILDANAIDRSQEVIRLAGWGFLPTLQPDQAVRVLFDDRVVADGIVVRQDGSFSVQLPSPQFRSGDLIITVEQRDGQRITRERTHFEMSLSDREEPIIK
jgi:hypothetical protein